MVWKFCEKTAEFPANPPKLILSVVPKALSQSGISKRCTLMNLFFKSQVTDMYVLQPILKQNESIT